MNLTTTTTTTTTTAAAATATVLTGQLKCDTSESDPHSYEAT